MQILFAIALLAPTGIDADVVIRGGTVYDGTGTKGRVADVAIKGDRIVAVGKFKLNGKPKVIMAQGLIVAPGFIDLHNHSDRKIVLKKHRAAKNYLTQGVTTIVTGNCGFGPVDVKAYLNQIDRLGAGPNVAHLIPHGSLRKQVMQSANRPPSGPELKTMKQLVRRGMKDGAFGISTGLIYVPGSFAKTKELVEISRVVASEQGIYVSHMRSEGTGLLRSVEETLRIGREAKLPVHVSHFKASGRPAWGLAGAAVRLILNARRKGQRITADQYPYTASSTSLAAMTVPARYRNLKKMNAALADARQAPKLKASIEKMIKQRGQGKALFVAGYAKNRSWQGKNIAQLAKQEGKTTLAIVLTMLKNGGAGMVNFGIQEEEVRLIMRQSFVATASDGSTREPSNTVPHPRSYGCFSRKIGRYAIEGKVVSLAHAIRSSTSLPAKILGLSKRGVIQVDFVADIVVFDPKTFRDVATFAKPHQYSTGVRYLLVNGQFAIANGNRTKGLSGRALRK